MATEGKRHGSLMVGQISHPGRQVSEDIQPHPISASDVQLKGKMPNVLNGASLYSSPKHDAGIWSLANNLQGTSWV